MGPRTLRLPRGGQVWRHPTSRLLVLGRAGRRWTRSWLLEWTWKVVQVTMDEMAVLVVTAETALVVVQAEMALVGVMAEVTVIVGVMALEKKQWLRP